MGNLRWQTQVYSTEIRKVLAYRFDFWINFFVSVFAHVAVAYFLWSAVFEQNKTETMQGYSFTGLMFYYLMVPIVDKMVNGSGMGFVSRDIYDGSLTRYLIYPVSFFKYKYIQNLANTTVFIIQLFITIFIFLSLFGMPSDAAVSPSSALMGIVAVICSGFLSYFINTTVELAAFWADNVWTLIVMIRFSVSLLGGAMIPLAFFPDAWVDILHLLPFSYMASFPIQSFLGKVSIEAWFRGIAVTLLWTGLFYVLLNIVWNRGKYKYTGVGI